ncbi:hypothetical protein C343_02403 [Cryptococcus neoformans C23]|uniref:Uncharacterized protein n=2 Tax=Cryptococcus neoformans TaxID=5207 RepID=A0A854QMM2_CRYNE|nr:hypothetical protein CNAG_05065 [Cryptococcus neoformans var. grubii H99]AUB23971.1 hypothetical protein CKF44_05065 [Cryptococcus neoformans var. grubii]OWZ33448.1 hypothetical protein C347_02471 [Cryptococcus neoformans var. grubii AD2-60a]OWZ45544.1 hypothetical protein C343_02403 [Cryptococcus neoformans var. grubii C23]OWZ55093.1 hypothetical protein C368_02892 [Cryptococcus neoformans var. grubii 125.91]OXC85605.1 hypothetical protein C344_02211 [Cryptococcus neoformans var. grubii AD|eukprot:XP_012048483.1 hypothetical protein CNAG_05065 [Cryptococcus neoformans var. grubii H99]
MPSEFKPKSKPKPNSPPTSSSIIAKETHRLTLSTLSSHCPHLLTPTIRLSSLLDIPLTVSLTFFLAAWGIAHLYIPIFAIPYWSGILTLVSPLWGSMQIISGELGKGDEKGAGRSRKGDGAQWLVYWLFYTVLGWMRGMVRVYRPGWVGVFEVGRSGVLVAVGGGWFSKSILMREKSKELIEAEKRETEEGRQASKGRGKSEKKHEKAEKRPK